MAARDVNLEVPPGCVFALMGPNGAGKTTIIRMLLGLLPITSGSASVLGLDSAKKHVEIRRRVGFLPSDFGLIPASLVLPCRSPDRHGCTVGVI